MPHNNILLMALLREYIKTCGTVAEQKFFFCHKLQERIFYWNDVSLKEYFLTLKQFIIQVSFLRNQAEKGRVIWSLGHVQWDHYLLIA